MTYYVSREVSERIRVRKAELERAEEERAETERRSYRRVMVKGCGVLLIGLAICFGQLIALMNAPLAFFVVFAYLCVQAGIWLY